MTKVFLSGSRHLTRLNPAIRERIDQVIASGAAVLIGDANGADRSMQAYLAEKGYDRVVVFCTGPACRNNLGGWETRRVEAVPGARKGFRFYALKDGRMSEEAAYGFAMWDGKSHGTLNNILNLLKQNKKVWVYFSPSNELRCLNSRRDLASLLADGGHETLDELEERLRIKKGTDPKQRRLAFTR
jgi:hypothetical protein